jgi:vesicle coat complex subunit
LITAAKDDPAPTVRATCVRSLANMKANTMPVITTVRNLTSDTDPRVRQEAERALSVLSAIQK